VDGLELRTPVQGKRATGSATDKCAEWAGHGDIPAFTLLAVKGGAGTGTDRGRTGDSERGSANTKLELGLITRDEVCWQPCGIICRGIGPVAGGVGVRE
jgi:hypothetical protein